jgi:hypothetical protein
MFDPVYEMVLAYFSVVLEITSRLEQKNNFDFFENAVYAAMNE